MPVNQNVDIITGYAQDISIKFKHADMIGGDVAPMFDMPAPSMKILTYNRGEQFQTNRKLRQPGSKIETTRIGKSFLTPTTEEYATADEITIEDIRDAGLPGMLSPPDDLVFSSIEKNAKDLDLGRELDVAQQLFAGTFSDGVPGGVDVAGSWATPSTSTFLADFDTADLTLALQGVPRSQKRLMVDFATLKKLKRIDDLREQLKYTTSKSLTAAMLAQILEISMVVVGDTVYNTDQAKFNVDAFTGKFIWSQNFSGAAVKGSAFLYNFEAPSKKSLNALIQPRSKVDGKNFRRTETYYNPEKKAFIYDSIEETTVLITATGAGFQWKDTILT